MEGKARHCLKLLKHLARLLKKQDYLARYRNIMNIQAEIYIKNYQNNLLIILINLAFNIGITSLNRIFII